jgi:hypothetical protein
MLTNQSCLESFGLIEELDEQAGETITGGATEVFTVKNKTPYNVSYTIDGITAPGYAANPNDGYAVWTAYSGGTIRYDKDSRNDFKDYITYDLSDGGVYEFQDNTGTPGNPYDIQLYKVG